MELHVSTQGADQLYRALGLDIVRVIAPAIEGGGYRVEGDFKVYPPPPPGSDYIRTGQYGGGWATSFSTTTTQAISEISNPVEYAGWVGSAEMQARVHQGRWVTDEQLLSQEAPRVISDVESLIMAAYNNSKIV